MEDETPDWRKYIAAKNHDDNNDSDDKKYSNIDDKKYNNSDDKKYNSSNNEQSNDEETSDNEIPPLTPHRAKSKRLQEETKKWKLKPRRKNAGPCTPNSGIVSRISTCIVCAVGYHRCHQRGTAVGQD